MRSSTVSGWESVDGKIALFVTAGFIADDEGSGISGGSVGFGAGCGDGNLVVVDVHGAKLAAEGFRHGGRGAVRFGDDFRFRVAAAGGGDAHGDSFRVPAFQNVENGFLSVVSPLGGEVFVPADGHDGVHGLRAAVGFFFPAPDVRDHFFCGFPFFFIEAVGNGQFRFQVKVSALGCGLLPNVVVTGCCDVDCFLLSVAVLLNLILVAWGVVGDGVPQAIGNFEFRKFFFFFSAVVLLVVFPDVQIGEEEGLGVFRSGFSPVFGGLEPGFIFQRPFIIFLFLHFFLFKSKDGRVFRPGEVAHLGCMG